MLRVPVLCRGMLCGEAAKSWVFPHIFTNSIWQDSSGYAIMIPDVELWA